MSLSGSSIVLLAIGAVLLVVGSIRVALYLADPVPGGQPLVRSVVPSPPLTALQQGGSTEAPALAPAPTVVSVPTPVLPTVAPTASPVPAAATLLGAAADDTPRESAAPSPGTGPSGKASAVPVAEAMAPLGDNFARVWHWVQETGEFIYYDPLVPEESTLEAVASGRTYLILVNESVTVLINGRELEFICDEGNCWNTVVWP